MQTQRNDVKYLLYSRKLLMMRWISSLNHSQPTWCWQYAVCFVFVYVCDSQSNWWNTSADKQWIESCTLSSCIRSQRLGETGNIAFLHLTGWDSRPLTALKQTHKSLRYWQEASSCIGSILYSSRRIKPSATFFISGLDSHLLKKEVRLLQCSNGSFPLHVFSKVICQHKVSKALLEMKPNNQQH